MGIKDELGIFHRVRRRPKAARRPPNAQVAIFVKAVRHKTLLFVIVSLALGLAGCVTPLPGVPGSPHPGGPGNGGTGLVGVIEIPVRTWADDGYRDTSTNPPGIHLHSAKGLWFGGSRIGGRPADYETSAFFRWQNVPIPAGAVILEARVRVKHVADAPSPVNRWNTRVDIRGFAYDNLAPFRADVDTETLARTAATVPWDILEPWTGAASAWHETPDIKEIVQEIVSRPGWKAGNSLGIAFDARPGVRPGDEYNRSIHTYESEPVSAAVLYVRYTR